MLISYDLHSPGQDYERVAEAIKSLGSKCARIQYSLWYVKSTLTSKEAADRVWRYMDNNDSLIVIDASNDDAAWCNINSEVSDFLRQQWRTYQYG